MAARTGTSFVVFVWLCIIIIIDVTNAALVTDVEVVNTENPCTPVNDQENVEQPGVDFTAGPFVTRHNPTAAITSMLSPLYISDSEQYEDDDDERSCILNVGMVQVMQAYITQVKVDFLALNKRVQTLEQDFKQSRDSSLNRETSFSFRQAVDISLAMLEDYFLLSLEELEKAVTDCFLRKDSKWESQMKKNKTHQYSHTLQITGLLTSFLPHFSRPLSTDPNAGLQRKRSNP